MPTSRPWPRYGESVQEKVGRLECELDITKAELARERKKLAEVKEILFSSGVGAEDSSEPTTMSKWIMAGERTKNLYEEKMKRLSTAQEGIDMEFDQRLRDSTDEEARLRDLYYEERRQAFWLTAPKGEGC